MSREPWPLLLALTFLAVFFFFVTWVGRQCSRAIR